MGSGILGTNLLAGHGFFGFDPTPNASATGTIHNLAAGNFQTAPDTNYVAPHVATQGQQAQNTGQVKGASTTAQSGAAAGASTGAGQYSPQDLAAYNLYASQAQDALNRAQAAYSTRQGNINSSFNTQQNELNSAADAARNQYQTGVTGNQQSRLTDANQIHTAANAGYQSLLHILGGLGAGGGSEAQFLAPDLVKQSMSQQEGQAGQAFAQNARSLDQNYGDFQNKEKNQRDQLIDWRNSQLATDQAAYNTTQQNLLNILAGLRSRSAAPTDLASSLNSVVSTIPNEVAQHPTYTGTTPVYNAPSLTSFETSAMPTAQVAPTAPGGASTPFLNLLLGEQKKQQPVLA